jgi:hypothetical protein
MIGFIDTFFYNLSYSQSITALPLNHPFHKSLGHTIHFLAMNLTQKLSLQITMKSSFHFLFNHLGVPTLQNSTQFSNANSLIQFSHPLLATDSRHIDSAWTTQKTRVTCQTACSLVHYQHCAWHGPQRRNLFCCPLINTRHRPQQKTQPLYCCVTSLYMSECV